MFERQEDQELPAPVLSLGCNLAYGVFVNILHIITEMLRTSKTADDVTPFNVEDMDDAGKGKVRYVAGWMVSYLTKKSRNYISKHLYTSNPSARDRVNKELHKLKVITTHVVVPYHLLLSTTRYPETVKATEARQYRSRGLIHVSDAFFDTGQFQCLKQPQF